jgi:lipopolysaccharide/colanic/teichoic acid biosynthesis glycosyltransferase
MEAISAWYTGCYLFSHRNPSVVRERLFTASDALPVWPATGWSRLRVAKRSIDILVATGLCLLLAPLLVATIVGIKLGSPGPILHRRRVVGRGRRAFDAFKFRSMRVDADCVLHADAELFARFKTNHKLPDDPRITPIGRMIRRCSIDELPQLFNVLRGEMSLIGPRMVTAPELERYGEHVDTLLSVQPGMTGLWQVSGRQTTTYERRVELDLHYVEHWSLMLDLRILLKTPLVVFRGEGAY